MVFNINKLPKATDASKLERWLGPQVETVSKEMKDWYGPPIALAGVPGNVWVHAGGDIRGPIRDGWEASALDYADDVYKRLKRGWRKATDPRQAKLNMAFASLSDLISEATGGKRQDLPFNKVGPAALAIGGSVSHWVVGNFPAAGAAPASSNVSIATTSATTGSFGFINAASGDTTHFVGAYPNASAAGTLLLYDRLGAYLKTASSSAQETCTGTISRYANITVTTAQDYAAGNFLFIEQSTVLASVAHNWTVCTYTNQAGATAKTLPSVAGLATGTLGRVDFATGWFAPLASGDTGISALTAMQASVATVTGSAGFVIGRPLAWMPCPIANITCQVDGINTAFNLVRIFDGACMAFLEVNKPATAATTYTGTFTICSG